MSGRAACFIWLFVCVLLAVSAASAHETRPAYLEIKETSPGQFLVLWRTPLMAGMRLPVVLKLPDNVRDLREPSVQELADSLVERRWVDAGTDGLAGKRIEFSGLQMTLTDVLVRVERLDGSSQVTRVMSSLPSFIVEAMPRPLEVARTYLVLGIEHILTGVDHLLFVSGLLLLVDGTRRLLLTVSAFTLSHTVTLTLATLGFCARTSRSRRGGNCTQHTVCRLGNTSKTLESIWTGAAQAVAGGFLIRLVARTGICGRTQCRWFACGSYPARSRLL